MFLSQFFFPLENCNFQLQLKTRVYCQIFVYGSAEVSGLRKSSGSLWQQSFDKNQIIGVREKSRSN